MSTIMVDFEPVLIGYHLDETWMFAMDAIPEKAMQTCRAAIEIHNRILEKAGPGAALGELFDHSVRLDTREGRQKAISDWINQIKIQNPKYRTNSKFKLKKGEVNSGIILQSPAAFVSFLWLIQRLV